MSATRSIGLVALSLLALAAPLAAQAPAAPAGVPHGARTVVYHARDLVTLRAKRHYTTLIVLPEGEQVVEATCGDKEFWIVNVRGGLVSVKPAEAGGETNLNVVGTSGQVYSFVLQEVSDQPTLEPDLAVYLETDDLAGASSAHSPKFVLATELDDYREQAAIARETARRGDRGCAGQTRRRPDRVSHAVSAQPAVSVSLQGEHEAVLRAGHVSRRPPHVHPRGRAGTAGALRVPGRPAQSRQLRGA